MLRRLRPSRDERQVPDQHDLALNLSFVLHEPSSSPAVAAAVRTCLAHAQRDIPVNDQLASATTRDSLDTSRISFWLTATIGVPDLLPLSLGIDPDYLIPIDDTIQPSTEHDFFRSPASLNLPHVLAGPVGVAALILRPDRTTSHLALAGPFDWPTHRPDALRSLERLIQAHVGQWTPPLPLWPAPAELLLADEVY